ncbi:hypothetical protein ABW16_19770 [Mycolicibacter heraklionensis]|uniref:Uncharacterized protein n=1 Tax=Mycolicibacter heraklionensis TaxID=512402 RepID=A0ABR5FB74_9MYCO|nr:hypothetical protein [Mycolicibacter heraklionensis]KLO26402.1 hypothetical protein ABW16_19770 [Mycolicibacter heraklionensis]
MERYSLVSFVAATITVAVFETITWAWFPYLVADLMLFGVVSLVVLPSAFFMSQASGRAAQIGRGVLVGYLATPLTAALTVGPTLVFADLLQVG